MRPKVLVDKELCRRFISVMASLSLNQAQFADKFSIRRSSISEIKNCRIEPTLGMIRSLIRETDINGNWLMNGVGEMYVTDNIRACEPCDHKVLSVEEYEALKIELTETKLANELLIGEVTSNTARMAELENQINERNVKYEQLRDRMDALRDKNEKLNEEITENYRKLLNLGKEMLPVT